jgi:hypothetical protein
MKENRTFAFRALQVFVCFAILYVLSFWVYSRSHVTLSIPPDGNVTRFFWYMTDTPLHRVLMFIYAPLSRLLGYEVVWH